MVKEAPVKRFNARPMQTTAALTILMLSVYAFAGDMTGTWLFDVQTVMGAGKATFELKQDGDKLTGTYSGALGSAKLTGSVSGNSFEWAYTLENIGNVTYSGVQLEDGTVKGDADYGNALGKATFTGARQ